MTVIALIEDDEAVLRSLAMLLESHGMTVRSYPAAEMFLGQLKVDHPHCVVSDIRMPGLSGIELQHELKKRNAAIPLILITGHGHIAMAVKAIKDGAFDFIEKPFDDERLMKSIGAAIAHSERERTEHRERASLKTRAAELSPRQREVMNLVAEGLSNKEVAARLDISPRTVENYRAWVMEKMGATNLADLVRKTLMMRSGIS